MSSVLWCLSLLLNHKIPTYARRIKKNDIHSFHLPRHVSFTMNQTFAKWGKVGHKLTETLINTTVSTTKTHARKLGKA